MRKLICGCFVAGLMGLAASSQAAFKFTDDFESGNLGNWTKIAATGDLDISNAKNKVPAGGMYSAQVNLSADGVYHNLGTELAGPSKLTYWLFDDSATRVWAEARGYSGAGYGDGSLAHLAAIGKYTSVTLPGDTFDGTKYQGRISLTASSILWFNLNAPGVPDRSAGWHEFTIERSADNNTVNFYVDGILGRSFTGVTLDAWDSVLLTSVRSGTTAGDAWFDGISVAAVPEPAAMGMLALGMLSMLARRRR